MCRQWRRPFSGPHKGRGSAPPLRRPPIGALSGSINLIRMDQPRYKFPIQFSNSREKTVIASAAKQSTLLSVAAMDCFAALAMTVNSTHTFALATRSARVVAFIFRPRENRGRGECRVPAAPAASCALCSGRSARVTTSTPESHGIPARNGFNGVCRALPGDRALLAPSSSDMFCLSPVGPTQLRELDASVGASGPHDFAVRSNISRQHAGNRSQIFRPALRSHRAQNAAASTASHPAFVTIMIRPSVWDGMAKVLEVIWGVRKQEYFCIQDWTGGIRLIRFNKFAVARNSVGRGKAS